MSIGNVSGSSRAAAVQHDSSLPEEPVQGEPVSIDIVEAPPPWTPPWAVPDPVNLGGGAAPPTSVGGGGPAEPAVTPPTVAGPDSAPGSKRDAPPIKTGLEKVPGKDAKLAPEVEKLLNASPYLRDIWAKAQANGWKIQFVTEGRSEANPGPPPRININLKNVQSEGGPERAAAIAALITHEMGHADTRYPELLLRPRNEQEFVEKNTAEALKHEGEATLANLKAREEILNATGIDIGVRGGLDDFYKGVYERMKLPPPEGLTREEGVRMLGDLQGAEPEDLETGANRKEGVEQKYRDRYRELTGQGQ
jgi:hypothetical protein